MNACLVDLLSTIHSLTFVPPSKSNPPFSESAPAPLAKFQSDDVVCVCTSCLYCHSPPSPHHYTAPFTHLFPNSLSSTSTPLRVRLTLTVSLSQPSSIPPKPQQLFNALCCCFSPSFTSTCRLSLSSSSSSSSFSLLLNRPPTQEFSSEPTQRF